MRKPVGFITRIGVLLLLAACASLPRGAALQSEIIQSESDESPPDYAVYQVSKETLAGIRHWVDPSVSRVWPSHSHSGAAPVVRAGDVIAITIWDSSENSLFTSPGERFVVLPDMTVSQSGHVTVPYLGRLKVSGMRREAVRSLIERRAVETASVVQVQIEVTPGRRQNVDIVGGVQSPGTFPITDAHFTVLNLISLGGGVVSNLRNPQVTLIRQGKRYVQSLNRLYETPSADTVLRSFDKVIVTEDDRYFRALGATEGDALLYFEEEEVTALDALAMMGGLSDSRADPQGILVLRAYPRSQVRADGSGPSHERVIFVIDLTSADGAFSAGEFRIQPKDTVFLTESPALMATALLDLVRRAFGVVTLVN